MLDKLGVRFEENYQDHMILSYLINPSGTYSIQDIGLNILNREIKSLEDYLGKGRNKKTLEELEEDEIKDYLSNNLFVLEGSLDILLDQVEDMDMLGVLNKIDLPLVGIGRYGTMVSQSIGEEFEKLDIKITENLKKLGTDL